MFLSATLLPVRYYQSLLSARTDDYAVYIPSPFAPSNRYLAIGSDVSSRYKRRTREEYVRMASYIRQVTMGRRGNYLVFFPSYRMLSEVYGIFEQEFLPAAPDGCRCVCQTPSMGEAAREDFLAGFQDEDGRTLIGFCVMGGIFAEGIDLSGKRLIGAIVVGTGLPQIGDERELLRRFYDRKGENGFDFAYRFPGMNKVLQSAGRVIRTTEDQGVILLLDERFRLREYRDLFPGNGRIAGCVPSRPSPVKSENSGTASGADRARESVGSQEKDCINALAAWGTGRWALWAMTSSRVGSGSVIWT